MNSEEMSKLNSEHEEGLPDQPSKFNNPYEAGYNAGRFGGNTFNSHFGWFNTKERMQEWQRGNNAGLLKKESERKKIIP